MDVEKIKKNKKEIVLLLNKNVLDNTVMDEILFNLSSNIKMGIDMRNVESIKSKKFIKCLIKNKFKLFNLKSEVLAYLAIVLKDGFLKSHSNYEDFSQNKREFIKRHFLVA